MWKSNLVKSIVIGGVAFSISTVAWNGTDSLNNIKSMYNELKTSYENALSNIGTYRNVLVDKQSQLEDLDVMRQNLSKDVEAKAKQIAELQAEIQRLEQEGETNNTNNQAEIQRLQGELDALQAEYENVQSDLNTLIADYNRVVADLEKANQEVANLETEIRTEHEQITMTEKITEEDILADIGGDVANMYMRFALAANSGQTGTTGTIEQGKQTMYGNEDETIQLLDALNLVDNYRESPVLLHFVSKTGAYMSSETAFATMYENATEVVDSSNISIDETAGHLYKIKGNTNNVYITLGGRSNRVGITLDTQRWINQFQYAELDK